MRLIHLNERVKKLELKEETRTRRYIDLSLSLEIEDRSIKIDIGQDTWYISLLGSNPQIHKNDRIVAVLHSGINKPFDAALDVIYTELTSITDQFRQLIQKEILAVVPKSTQ